MSLQDQESIQSKILTVGVTGGIASGKTTVCHYFAGKGIDIIDSDQIGRELLEPGQPSFEAVLKHFGERVLKKDRSIDRKWLRHVIFEDEKERVWLESLLHPLIEEQVARQLARVKSPYTILVSPLMVETNQVELVDRLLVVDLSESLQLQRTIARDHITEQQAKKIILTQAGRDQRLGKADDIVDNSGTLEQLNESLEKLHNRYLVLAAQR